ncbi:MAG: Gfo/Idh/MocA family oxidoreductase [Actinomycetota bacterium]|nr:Gfo/Idh/MocA family oxidoreductase [Actinomycetota bacterium]
MTLGVACVGGGWVTRERHLPALKGDGRLRVLGVVDSHPERAQGAARAFGLPHWGTSLDESWMNDVDCLTIGTPPPAHAELVRSALERGWHCLCEKPFALPATEAAELVRVARDAGLVLGVVHNFQFSRSGQRLFDLVESGQLGAVEAVYGFQLSNPKRRLPHWYQDLPGGLFLDEAPHLLYLIRRLLGRLDPRGVDARLGGNEIRDLNATFEHASIWASLSMGFGASVSEWQFIVVGTSGVAALDVFRDILIVLPDDGSHRAREILRSSARMVAGHVAGVASSGARVVGRRLLYGNDEVVRRFVDSIEGRPERLRWMTGEDGCAIVACMEEILGRVGIDATVPALS